MNSQYQGPKAGDMSGFFQEQKGGQCDRGRKSKREGGKRCVQRDNYRRRVVRAT